MLTRCVRLSLTLGIAITLGFSLYARAQSFTVTEVGELPNHYGASTGGINQAGQIAGTAPREPTDNSSDAFLYSNGQSTNLGNPPGGDQTIAVAINNHGEVVGTDFMGRSPVAYLYSNGIFTIIPLGPAGFANYAGGINNRSQVTGINLSGLGPEQVFLYENGTTTILGAFPGGSSVAGSGINDFGEITGYAVIGDVNHAFLYHHGTYHDIGTLRGGMNSTGTAINDLGMITGNADNAEGSTHAFLWRFGHMKDLGIPNGGVSSYGEGLNLFGDVVGNYLGSDGVQAAFLYSEGTLKDLNSLIPADSPWFLIAATGINNKGQIAATGLSKIPDGPLGFPAPTHAFLLTPVCTDHDRRSRRERCFCDQPHDFDR